MPRLVFVTPNAWDAAERQRLLAGLDVEFSRLALDRGPGATLHDVARHRARAAFAALGRPCFVENTELALDGGPAWSGAAFKKLHRALGDDGFCAQWGGRRGTSRVVVAWARAGDDVVLFEGDGDGAVATTPRGQGGFGWDRLWVPDGFDRTVAELGQARSLVNVRQRPYLELAALVRGDGTPGYFEAHVTVKPCDLAAFARACDALGTKCLHIVMPAGTAQAEQPMTASYFLGTLSQAREQAHRQASELVRAGFEVTRVKLEATGRAFGAPETDEAAQALPLDVYFEHHATIVVNGPAQLADVERQCRALGGYVSQNRRKPAREAFVTVRSYRVGRATADARFERLVDALHALGVSLKNRAREYAVYDSAPFIDEGWMG